MATTYTESPTFAVANLVAEGDFVLAIGTITTKDDDEKAVHSSYWDVWCFRSAKIITGERCG